MNVLFLRAGMFLAIISLAGCQTTDTQGEVSQNSSGARVLAQFEYAKTTICGVKSYYSYYFQIAQKGKGNEKAWLEGDAQQIKSHCDAIPTNGNVQDMAEWGRRVYELNRNTYFGSARPFLENQGDKNLEIRIAAYEIGSCGSEAESALKNSAEVAIKHNPPREKSIKKHLNRTIIAKRKLCALPRSTLAEMRKFAREHVRVYNTTTDLFNKAMEKAVDEV